MSVNGTGSRLAGSETVDQRCVDQFFRRLALVTRRHPAPRALRDFADAVHRLLLPYPLPATGEGAHETVHLDLSGAAAGNGHAARRPGRTRLANGRYAAAGTSAGEASSGPSSQASAGHRPAGAAASDQRWEQQRTEALMEHLGHLAVGAARDAEAEALAGALVPLAFQLLPAPPSPALLTAVPRLVGSTSALVRGLRGDPAIRPLLRLVPAIVHRGVSRHVLPAPDGGRIDVVENVADEARDIFADPAACVELYGRSRSADQRFHSNAVADLS